MPLLALLISLVIWGLIFWLAWWAVGALEIPDPFHKVISVILILAAIIVIIGLLTGGLPPFPILTGSVGVR